MNQKLKKQTDEKYGVYLLPSTLVKRIKSLTCTTGKCRLLSDCSFFLTKLSEHYCKETINVTKQINY